MAYLAEIDPDGEPSPITVDWHLAFVHAATRKGYAYWQKLRGERLMPGRRELRPRDMCGFLEHANLVDVIAEGDGHFDYAISLQGAKAREVFGHMRGGRISEILPPRLQPRWRDGFGMPVAARAPVRLMLRASTFGKKWLVTETLLAPLGDDTGGVHALFWVFAAWRDG